MPQQVGEPRTLSDAAFLRLRADIMTGALKPGTKLKIGDLVTRYEVGASPLREALARLSSDHMVVLEGQRGFTVAAISREELADLARVRGLIESEAVALSIARGDVEWEARIVASYFRLQKAQHLAQEEGRWSLAWEDCNRQFHDALLSGCGSIWLLRVQQQLYAQSVRYRFIAFDQPQLPRDGDAEHKALMDACLSRNVERAQRLTIEHIERTAKAIAAILPDAVAVEDKAASRILQVLNGNQPSKPLRSAVGKVKPPSVRKSDRPAISRRKNDSRRASK